MLPAYKTTGDLGDFGSSFDSLPWYFTLEGDTGLVEVTSPGLSSRCEDVVCDSPSLWAVVWGETDLDKPVDSTGLVFLREDK